MHGKEYRWKANGGRGPDVSGDPLGELVFVSRLIGRDPSLVLAGGGNTSVKTSMTDVFGETIDVLYIKGSGYDLGCVDRSLLVPVDLARLRRLIRVDELSDSALIDELRRGVLDGHAPRPSVESLLHAALPFKFVLHSHADAFLAISNTEDAEARFGEIYGDDVLFVPYARSGLPLAKACVEALRESGEGAVALLLSRHGVVTFGASADEAYARMVDVVSRAEAYLESQGVRWANVAEAHVVESELDMGRLSALRQTISKSAGRPLVMRCCAAPDVMQFVKRSDVGDIAARGPMTPDHAIRTKRLPMIGTDVEAYAAAYRAYFQKHAGQKANAEMVDPAPRLVLDPEVGLLALGEDAEAADVAEAIYRHTIRVIEAAELIGGYRPLDAARLFDIEYWAPEQAKRKPEPATLGLAGQVALVTGAASGIGRACAKALLGEGVAVCGLDIDARVETACEGAAWLGLQADVGQPAEMQRAIAKTIARFGGIDIVVVAAGVFGASTPIAELTQDAWRCVMSINADSVLDLLHKLHPLLAGAAVPGRVVVIGSKNVPAPGVGAAAYSASKAALTQLCRVAALEWAADGITLNLVHPDAVFDTGLWTDTLIEERARRYGMSVADYKRRNLLRTDITSDDVAALVVAMCGPGFAKTTGAQVPIDGGNERVV